MITGKQLVEEYKKTIGRYTYAQRDCIGSIWKILEKYGAKTSYVGSNWFARHELKNMRPLTDKSQLYDGCAVLKTKLKGESGYNLPPKYQSDADLIDYNHIGIGTDKGEIYDSTRYTDSAGKYIRNGPGLSTAKIGPNSWDIIADFEDVDYSDGGETMTATVHAVSGGTVRMRISPTKTAIVAANVPVGSTVEVTESGPEWSGIRWAGKSGYMQSEFLRTETPPAEQSEMITVRRDMLQAIVNELNGMLRA